MKDNPLLGRKHEPSSRQWILKGCFGHVNENGVTEMPVSNMIQMVK